MKHMQPFDILLVEDSPKDIKLAMRAFSRHNLQNAVQVVRDGASAIDVLMGDAERSTSTAKLVLLDLKLPKIDGLEVLRRIRAHPVLHSLPVVLLTTSRDSHDIEQGYELGCNTYAAGHADPIIRTVSSPPKGGLCMINATVLSALLSDLGRLRQLVSERAIAA